MSSTLVGAKLIISLGFDNMGVPLECLALHGYYNLLLGWTLTPLLVVLVYVSAATVLGELQHFLGLTKHREQVFSLQRVLIECLPTVLRICFIAYPLVSTVAFRAFELEDFGEAGRYLVSDYSVKEGTDEYRDCIMLAAVAIGIYPLGIPLLYALLLYRARHAIQAGRDTSLSKALKFLHKDYRPAFFAWELIENLRRFLLVGVAVLIRPGSLLQLLCATLVTLLLLFVQLQVRPFRRLSDEALSSSCSLSLGIFFVCCMLLKIGQLTDMPEVEGVLTSSNAAKFDVVSLRDGVLFAAISTPIGVILLALFVHLTEDNLLFRRMYLDESTKLCNTKRFRKDLVEIHGGAAREPDSARAEGTAFISAGILGLEEVAVRHGEVARKRALAEYGRMWLGAMEAFDPRFGRLRGYFLSHEQLSDCKLSIICEQAEGQSAFDFAAQVSELVQYIAAEVTYLATRGRGTLSERSARGRTRAKVKDAKSRENLGMRRLQREAPSSGRLRMSVVESLKKTAQKRYSLAPPPRGSQKSEEDEWEEVYTFLRVGAGSSWQEAELSETAVRTNVNLHVFGSVGAGDGSIAGRGQLAGGLDGLQRAARVVAGDALCRGGAGGAQVQHLGGALAAAACRCRDRVGGRGGRAAAAAVSAATAAAAAIEV
jgi:hypothetical protein